MILTKEQISSITDNEGVYECGLIVRQFAYGLINNQVSPLGDLFCFNAPVRIGPLGMEEALVFAGELPNISMFGAVCFQRLFATQIGSLLSMMTGKEYFVDDSCLFADDVQASIMISNKVKDSVVFHMIFPIVMFAEQSRFTLLELEEKLAAEFKRIAIDAFRHLIQSIFVETRRDNF